MRFPTPRHGGHAHPDRAGGGQDGVKDFLLRGTGNEN
jgi:hypothetical protein